MELKKDAQKIMAACLTAARPDEAVSKAIDEIRISEGRLIMIAAGKAAWAMANAARQRLGERIDEGCVITKYDHVMGEIPGILCLEAGHPIPDRNSFMATRQAIAMVSDLKSEDQVLFLISGGGSALFEDPLIPEEELYELTQQLLASGADIVEINTIRKRLSRVKGGRFARLCAPAKVEAIILSDIIGDPLDMIASGPAYPDSSTWQEADAIIHRYGLKLSPLAMEHLRQETPKVIDNVTTYVTGSVSELCRSAAQMAEQLGYRSIILTDRLTCQAKEAGSFLGAIARTHAQDGPLAFIAGGETVVQLTGTGKGGRNQELALAAADQIAGLDQVMIFSLGSDGTDGPTDAAGGIVDGSTKQRLADQGIDLFQSLKNNDAYHALKAADALIITGPTGTNVNDVAVLLIGPV